MELKQLTDRVFYTGHNKEADRPALGYINGQKYSLMIDSGNSQRHVEQFNRSIAGAGLRKPDYIAITRLNLPTPVSGENIRSFRK